MSRFEIVAVASLGIGLLFLPSVFVICLLLKEIFQ